MELASWYPYGAKNFEATLQFLENLCVLEESYFTIPQQGLRIKLSFRRMECNLNVPKTDINIQCVCKPHQHIGPPALRVLQGPFLYHWQGGSTPTALPCVDPIVIIL
jgi:hypothetical protein